MVLMLKTFFLPSSKPINHSLVFRFLFFKKTHKKHKKQKNRTKKKEHCKLIFHMKKCSEDEEDDDDVVFKERNSSLFERKTKRSIVGRTRGETAAGTGRLLGHEGKEGVVVDARVDGGHPRLHVGGALGAEEVDLVVRLRHAAAVHLAPAQLRGRALGRRARGAPGAC